MYDHQNPPQKGGFFYFKRLVALDDISIKLNKLAKRLYCSNFSDDSQTENHFDLLINL